MTMMNVVNEPMRMMEMGSSTTTVAPKKPGKTIHHLSLGEPGLGERSIMVHMREMRKRIVVVALNMMPLRSEAPPMPHESTMRAFRFPCIRRATPMDTQRKFRPMVVRSGASASFSREARLVEVGWWVAAPPATTLCRNRASSVASPALNHRSFCLYDRSKFALRNCRSCSLPGRSLRSSPFHEAAGRITEARSTSCTGASNGSRSSPLTPTLLPSRCDCRALHVQTCFRSQATTVPPPAMTKEPMQTMAEPAIRPHDSSMCLRNRSRKRDPIISTKVS
mmetsp:Transcript_4701/g.15216  ORF Transcript_4701/g.15216 Transcript_4701/m.15216 type:complete len:279 (+) Transcript_4701:223-1059(+)